MVIVVKGGVHELPIFKAPISNPVPEPLSSLIGVRHGAWRCSGLGESGLGICLIVRDPGCSYSGGGLSNRKELLLCRSSDYRLLFHRAELGGFEERSDRKKGAPREYYQVCDTLTAEADSELAFV